MNEQPADSELEELAEQFGDQLRDRSKTFRVFANQMARVTPQIDPAGINSDPLDSIVEEYSGK